MLARATPGRELGETAKASEESDFLPYQG